MKTNMKWMILFLSSLVSFEALSGDNVGRNNVILLMLDGVRWQEVFRGTDPHLNQGRPPQILFRHLHQELASQGVFIGNRDQGSEMVVANSALISLPAYQSIMAGATQPCSSNDCGRIKVETMPERIRRELGLSSSQVATIASWKKIPLAAEHIEGRTFVNAGLSPLQDQSGDRALAELNRQQMGDLPPWGDARYDKYTYSLALHYLKKHRPRFMFISLNDSDEWAHKGNYPEYLKTLQQYDQWIRELASTLKEMGDYGKATTLIVTTDHGRGDKDNWKHHGSSHPEASFIWLFGLPVGTSMETSNESKPFLESYTHNDIRPTIEGLLGLPPRDCQGCGRIIQELMPKGEYSTHQ